MSLSSSTSLATRLLGGHLAPDVMADVRRRLRIAALLCGILYPIILLAHVIQVRYGVHEFRWQMAVATTVISGIGTRTCSAPRWCASSRCWPRL